MYEKINSNPDIYKIYVPLPRNPLKNLNCYVIKTDDRNLMIDTGFNQPECIAALRQGIRDLGMDMNKTDIFITHIHSDHCGIITDIVAPGTRVFMGRVDYVGCIEFLVGDLWHQSDLQYLKEGFTEEQMEYLESKNPAIAYSNHVPFDAIELEDGDKIKVGDYECTAIFTPGHTPGHMCLYMEKEKIMFLGDHVLYDITPNITMWTYVDDSLGDYIRSLKRIRTYDIKLALPAHRDNNLDFYERVEALINHHNARLMDSYKIIKAHNGYTAYDIAGYMKWDIVCDSWEDFPLIQKWFAVGEALAHLHYLIKEGYVESKPDENGINHYYLVKEAEGNFF